MAKQPKRTATSPKRESWGPRSRRLQRAVEREAVRATRSDAMQLALLDARRGASTRERERLATRLQGGGAHSVGGA
jgi:hypothetical protein